MARTSLIAIAAAAALILSSSSGRAEGFASSAGAKIFAGGNLWTAPTGVPPGYIAGFVDTAGGMGFGGGAYAEVRPIPFLGAEVGAAYDRSQIRRDITINGVVKLTEKFTTTSLRVPLLVKGILPAPFGRLSLGLGPELIVPLGVDAGIEIREGRQYVADPSAVEKALRAEKTGSTMLTGALGIVLELPPSLEIPIDFRASKNLSQSDAWKDRVPEYTVTPSSFTYTVKAQSSWDFRLGAGVGWRF